MAGDLKGVIRLRKWEVDEKRRALGQLLERETQIRDLMHRLAEEEAAEAAAAQSHLREGGLTLGAYTARAITHRRALEEALHQTRAEIEQAQDAVAEAFKELKTYEIAQEARDTRETAEREHKIQTIQDEISLTLHRRRAEKP